MLGWQLLCQIALAESGLSAYAKVLGGLVDHKNEIFCITKDQNLQFWYKYIALFSVIIML
jgi:hypothetical protein